MAVRSARNMDMRTADNTDTAHTKTVHLEAALHSPLEADTEAVHTVRHTHAEVFESAALCGHSPAVEIAVESAERIGSSARVPLLL